MRKLLTAAVATVALGAGSLAVATLSPLGSASAQDDPPPPADAPEREDRAEARAQRLTEALAPLVADGTLTQAQSDAVVDRLGEVARERGEHARGRVHDQRAARLATVAEALGMETEAVAAALRDGSTIAELAGDQVGEVIDALVAEAEAHVAESVAAGRIDEERAEEILDGIEERVSAMVNGERPERPRPFSPHGRGFGPGGPPEDVPSGFGA